MALPPEYLAAIEALRVQLSQLATSLTLLKQDLSSPNLPSWPSLQASTSMLGQHLASVNNTLNAHRTLLANLHAYPLPNFPGHARENEMQQLLRKKLDPRAENWIDQCTQVVDETINGEASKEVKTKAKNEPFSTKDMDELLSSATLLLNRIVKPMWNAGLFDDDYTIAERKAGIQNVKTGLKRKLGKRLPAEDYHEIETEDDEGDEDAEQEDDVGDDMDNLNADDDEEIADDATITDKVPAKQPNGINIVLPNMPLDSMLRLMSAGRMD